VNQGAGTPFPFLPFLFLFSFEEKEGARVDFRALRRIRKGAFPFFPFFPFFFSFFFFRISGRGSGSVRGTPRTMLGWSGAASFLVFFPPSPSFFSSLSSLGGDAREESDRTDGSGSRSSSHLLFPFLLLFPPPLAAGICICFQTAEKRYAGNDGTHVRLSPSLSFFPFSLPLPPLFSEKQEVNYIRRARRGGPGSSPPFPPSPSPPFSFPSSSFPAAEEHAGAKETRQGKVAAARPLPIPSPFSFFSFPGREYAAVVAA